MRVASLDWWHAPGPTRRRRRQAADHGRLVEARQAAEAAAFEALASSPRRLRAFRRLLADAQHLVPVREEQAGELTIAWPVMRRAVLRIGEALVARGVIAEADDVFFLTRDEALAALEGAPRRASVDVAARRAQREEQAASCHRCASAHAPDDEAAVGWLPGCRRQAVGRRARVGRAGVAGSRDRDQSG